MEKEPKIKPEQVEELSQALEVPEPLFDEQFDGENIGRDNRGRPTVMTKQVLQKLEMAFKFGSTDREACIYAGIALQTLYNYGKKNPDYLEQKEEFKESMVIAARAVICDAIVTKQSVGDSWEILKRKRKEEFAELKKTDVTVNRVKSEDIGKNEKELIDNGDIEASLMDDEEEVEEEEED